MARYRGAYSGAVVNPMGSFQSLSGYARAVDAASRQDRAHELNMRELEYLATRQALGLDQQRQQQSAAAGANADQFLTAWNNTLMASQGVYNRALQAYEGTYDWMRDASESARRLGDLAGTVESEFQQFRTDFAGLEGEFRTAATEELGARQRMGAQMEQLATADYEGAAGRAMADVATQAEIGRQAEARRLQSLGIDPSSPRGRAVMERQRSQEMTSRAIAGNIARRGEKERVTGATATAMQLFDPSQMAQMAMGIRGAGTQLIQTAAGLRGAETEAMGGLARTQAAVASGMADVGRSMATTIGGQQADVAGLYAGLQYGAQNQPGAPGGAAIQPYQMHPSTRPIGMTPVAATSPAPAPQPYGAGSYFQPATKSAAFTSGRATDMTPAYSYSA